MRISDWSSDVCSSVRLPEPGQRPAAFNEEALRVNAEILEGVLGDFGVRGEIAKVNPGPVVTLYELEPAPGTKSSRVIGLADDIRSEEHTSELQSLMRTSYALLRLKKQTYPTTHT